MLKNRQLCVVSHGMHFSFRPPWCDPIPDANLESVREFEVSQISSASPTRQRSPSSTNYTTLLKGKVPRKETEGYMIGDRVIRLTRGREGYSELTKPFRNSWLENANVSRCHVQIRGDKTLPFAAQGRLHRRLLQGHSVASNSPKKVALPPCDLTFRRLLRALPSRRLLLESR